MRHHLRWAVLALVSASVGLGACKALAPGPGQNSPLESDFQPPALLEARPMDGRSFFLRFDEEISPIEASFGLEPSTAPPEARAEGKEVVVTFGEEGSPGTNYNLAGEVEDGRGNRTRFVLSFVGYNAHPAILLLSEVQTQKNSSVKTPHRDFVEFAVVTGGNLGGLELSWASGTRLMSFHFPAAEVVAGGFVVLHLAPEGIASEVDETGADLSASGGIDTSPGARDFWSLAGGLPDESGALCLRTRPGGSLEDALFYSADDRSGALPDGRLVELVNAVSAEGGWTLAGKAAYEDGFRWNPSSARSFSCRKDTEDSDGADDWFVTEASAQSPGLPNPGP